MVKSDMPGVPSLETFVVFAIDKCEGGWRGLVSTWYHPDPLATTACSNHATVKLGKVNSGKVRRGHEPGPGD